MHSSGCERLGDFPSVDFHTLACAFHILTLNLFRIQNNDGRSVGSHRVCLHKHGDCTDNCIVGNVTYRHDETFKLDCKTQCVCEVSELMLCVLSAHISWFLQDTMQGISSGVCVEKYACQHREL